MEGDQGPLSFLNQICPICMGSLYNTRRKLVHCNHPCNLAIATHDKKLHKYHFGYEGFWLPIVQKPQAKIQGDNQNGIFIGCGPLLNKQTSFIATSKCGHESIYL